MTKIERIQAEFLAKKKRRRKNAKKMLKEHQLDLRKRDDIFYSRDESVAPYYTLSKPVLQISLEGKVLAKHGSLSNAGKAVSTSQHAYRTISNAIKNGKKAYGYKWSYIL